MSTPMRLSERSQQRLHVELAGPHPMVVQPQPSPRARRRRLLCALVTHGTAKWLQGTPFEGQQPTRHTYVSGWLLSPISLPPVNSSHLHMASAMELLSFIHACMHLFIHLPLKHAEKSYMSLFTFLLESRGHDLDIQSAFQAPCHCAVT